MSNTIGLKLSHRLANHVQCQLKSIAPNIQILQISAFNEQTAEEQELVKVLPRSEKETFGVQRDSKGALWTPATSYEFKFSDKDGASQKVWRLNSKIEESPGMVSLLTDDLLIELDENKKIKMTVRTQSKREFKLLDEKTLIAMCTVRSFDEGGLSLSTIKEVCVFRKIDRFKERNTFEEYDLRASFSKYLQNTGKGHLISPRTMETE